MHATVTVIFQEPLENGPLHAGMHAVTHAAIKWLHARCMNKTEMHVRVHAAEK